MQTRKTQARRTQSRMMEARKSTDRKTQARTWHLLEKRMSDIVLLNVFKGGFLF